MKVTKAELVRLLVLMQVSTADKWDEKVLVDKVNATGGVARFKEEDRDVDPEVADLYARVTAAQAAGDRVELSDAGAAPVAPAPGTNGKAPKAAAKKPAPKAAKKPAGKPTTAAKAPKAGAAKPKAAAGPKAGKKPAAAGRAASTKGMTWPEEYAYRLKNPRPIPAEGVTKAVYDELAAAGKGAVARPVTLDAVVAALTAKFGDRDPAKMRTTASNLVSTKFRWKFAVTVNRCKVLRDGARVMGYWVGPAAAPDPDPKKVVPVVVTGPKPKRGRKPAGRKAGKK